MIPYLVFAYKTNLPAKGGIEDYLMSLVYNDDRTATESWIADLQASLEDFRTYNQFQLVRVNVSSIRELEIWNSSASE